MDFRLFIYFFLIFTSVFPFLSVWFLSLFFRIFFFNQYSSIFNCPFFSHFVPFSLYGAFFPRIHLFIFLLSFFMCSGYLSGFCSILRCIVFYPSIKVVFNFLYLCSISLSLFFLYLMLWNSAYSSLKTKRAFCAGFLQQVAISSFSFFISFLH